MILPIGMHQDPETGELHERVLVFGRTIMDAQMKTVGAKGTAMLSLRVSPGRDEEIVGIKLWGYDAQDHDGLPKGTMVLADCLKECREYMGKTYTDYVPRNFAVLGHDTPAKKRSRKSTTDVPPEDPYAGFTDIQNREELPF